MKRFKKTAGFTLVELIVVIAIMAILAGVGTVGYSAYITSANKKADMTTVGNILRAIDTGINSYTFEVPEALQIENSNVKIPAGFIVLSDTGVKAIQSNTTQTTVTSKPCKIIRNAEVYTGVTRYQYGRLVKKIAYKPEGMSTETFCETHGHVVKTKLKIGNSIGDTNPSEKEIYIVQDKNFLYGDHIDEDTVDMPVYQGDSSIIENGILNDIMVAAYGEEWQTAVSLKYNQWGNSSVSAPTFYNDASELWTQVEDMTNQLANISKTENVMILAGKDLGFTRQYEDGKDVLTSFSKKLSDKTREDFLREWNADITNVDYPFGFSKREDYSAARMLYNASFASYVKEHHTGGELAQTHADGIYHYGDGIDDLVLPKAVCNQAFTETEGYVGKISAVNDGCDECKTLLADYINSGACNLNGEAIYDTFTTLSKTSGTASGAMNDANSFWKYYKGYLGELDGLYSAVNLATKTANSSIVISIFYENGNVTYEVIPVEANPRN